MIKIKYINPFFIPTSFKTLSLTAALTTFHVKVFTGDVWGAGTDANVYIILFGDKDTTGENRESDFVWFVWFGFLTSSSTTRLYRGLTPTERLTILRAVTHKTELGDHDFCLSRLHYTDTDPTSREWAATAGIEPGTSSPGVGRSTD